MKVQIKIFAVAMISIVMMSFNPIDNQSSEDILRPIRGVVSNVDNLNGCMTIDRCSGGTFSFGIVAAGPGGSSFYPNVGETIVVTTKSMSGVCNNVFLESWSTTNCY